LIIHEMPENLSGLASQPAVSHNEIKSYANAADNLATLLHSIFLTEYLHGPYGKDYYAKIFLSLMFRDRDMISLSRYSKKHQNEVRFPMLLSYLELRRQMLETILEEIEGERYTSRSWRPQV